MAKKQVPEEDSGRTNLKVSKDLFRRLAVIAAHKELSTSALGEQVLREYVAKERPKMIAEMQEED